MLYRLLNQNKQFLDFTVFMHYMPSSLLRFFYCSDVFIELSSVRQLSEWSEEDSAFSPVKAWQTLISDELNALPDLKIMEDNPYISRVGPYYHHSTNTRFFFTRYNLESCDPLTAADLDKLLELSESPKMPAILKENSRQAKNQKSLNSRGLSKEIELIKTALIELEKNNRHLLYLEKMKSRFLRALQPEHLNPAKPEFNLTKPEKYPEGKLAERTWLSFLRKKRAAEEMNAYQHQVKIYYICYREFEKACDRYKESCICAPENIRQIKETLTRELLAIDEKIRSAESACGQCHALLSRSLIHEDYHEVSALEKFGHYLKTGRAKTLSECMNLYEEELRWNSLQSSQDRIEKSVDELHSGGQERKEIESKIQYLLTQSEPSRPKQLQSNP